MSAPQEHQTVLEDWLDGELGEQACNELRERLSRDPAFAGELTRLQSERQLRSTFWQCCEPGVDELDALANAVRRNCLKHQLWHDRFRRIRNGAAIAATFAVVFGSGWMSRSRMIRDDRSGSPRAVTAVAENNNPTPSFQPRSWPVESVGNFTMPQATPWPNETSLASFPTDATGLSTRRPNYRLVLVDPMGTPIDSQEVDDVRDPQKLKARFAEFENHLESAQHPASFVNQILPGGH